MTFFFFPHDLLEGPPSLPNRWTLEKQILSCFHLQLASRAYFSKDILILCLVVGVESFIYQLPSEHSSAGQHRVEPDFCPLFLPGSHVALLCPLFVNFGEVGLAFVNMPFGPFMIRVTPTKHVSFNFFPSLAYKLACFLPPS